MEIVFVFSIVCGIAFNVSSSILKCNFAANLIALIGLNPSSENLSNGEPTVRIILFFKSFCPSNGSTIFPSCNEAAIALIVKSLL